MSELREILVRIISVLESDGNSLRSGDYVLMNANDSNAVNTRPLSDFLYQKFYSAGTPSISISDENELQEVNTKFRKELVLSYNPIPAPNKGWMIVEKEQNNIAYFQKETEIVRSVPGMYLQEFDADDHGTRMSHYYSVITMPQYMNPDDYFYFIHGNIPEVPNENPIVRFYFNIHPQGSPVLIQALSEVFNRFRIPFSFKCCSSVNSYSRTDAAVLYVSSFHFTSSIQLLEKIYPKIKEYLKNGIPLFTRQIAQGISFAENPNNEMSFGQYRCQVIADAIGNCMIKKIPKDQWINEIIGQFKQLQFDTENLYLNPKSTYPYPFHLASFI